MTVRGGHFASEVSCMSPISNLPGLTLKISNNVGGATNGGWTWTLHVANAGTAPATFSSGQTIVLDNLPNSHIDATPGERLRTATVSIPHTFHALLFRSLIVAIIL